MSRFADKTIRPGGIGQGDQNDVRAVPLLLWSTAWEPTQKEAEKLAVLKRKAHFIPVFPATNGYHAKVLGLQSGLNADPDRNGSIFSWRISLPRRNGSSGPRRQSFWWSIRVTTGPITETADVVLPSLLWYEQEGSLYNLEGKKVAVRKAVPLPEGLIPENEVLTQLAARLVGG